MKSLILPHAHIQNLSPYVPGKSIDEVAKEYGLTDIIKLASNENPLGCSPRVIEILQELNRHQMALYPAPSHHRLYPELADYLQVTKDALFISNGSDPIFGLLMNCFALHQNKHLLTHQFAFATYAIQAKTLGIKVKICPDSDDWQVRVEDLIHACKKNTGLIILANPNNPTGTLISFTDIQKLLENIPKTTLVVIDEAYHEYAAEFYQADNLALLKKHNNLVITRTFSKVYGLAALRIGYAISQPEIIQWLQRIQLPFFVNFAALEAASAALSDQDFVQETLRIQAQVHVQLQAGLSALNIRWTPSATNFITMDCGEFANEINLELQKSGIILRPLLPYGLPRHLRITVGTEMQNNRLLNELSKFAPRLRPFDRP